MKKTSIFAVISFLMIFTAALVAQEQTIDVDVETDTDGPQKIIKIRKGDDVEHIVFNQADMLNLTDEQKKEFKKIDLAFEKDIISTKNELEVARLEMDVAMDEDNPDLKKINNLIDTIHAKEASIEKKRIATDLKKRDLLTDEQKKNWTLHRPGHMKKEIIMLKGDGADDMMWFGDDDTHLPAPPKMKRKMKVVTE